MKIHFQKSSHDGIRFFTNGRPCHASIDKFGVVEETSTGGQKIQVRVREKSLLVPGAHCGSRWCSSERGEDYRNVRLTGADLKCFVDFSGQVTTIIFIRGCAGVAAPMKDLLRQDAFQWSSVAQESFEDLKYAMICAPVLSHPDFSKPFSLNWTHADQELDPS